MSSAAHARRPQAGHHAVPVRLAVVALAVACATANAQSSAWIRPELRTFGGAFLPRGSVGRYAAMTFGLQSALELTDFAEGVLSAGWARERTTVAAFANPAASVWQYDAGIEFNSTQPRDNGWIMRPFAGGGAGGRTYQYAERGTRAATYPSSYGSIGIDVQGGATAYRLEVRGYLSPFNPPLSGMRQVRADISITGGFAHHF